jgi:glycosyltransferase involved in cell wall biosynthesis
MLSIVITYHEEGFGFLMECLTQLRESIDVQNYEIIIVDDMSAVPLPKIEGTTIIRNSTNIGVGRSFDVGIEAASYDNIIFMACDMRFIANNWVSKLVTEIEVHPKAITCTCCVGINKDNMNFLERRLVQRCYGATILMYNDKEATAKSRALKNIIEAKWQLLDKTSIDRSYELPCILGACYGVKKSWYKYIDGFWGHIKWGTLEPYISLKSWLFGGSCRIAPHIETAHIFKLTGTHSITQDNLFYNKMLVSSLLLESDQKFITHLGTNTTIAKSAETYNQNKTAILAKRAEYRDKKVLSESAFCKKFKIDMRNDNPLSEEYNGIYTRKDAYKCPYSKSPYLRVWNEVAEHIHVSNVVVDLGCGPGQLMERLFDLGISRYIGYDFSRVACELAQAIVEREKRNALILHQDLYELTSLPDADVYVAVEVMEHLTNDMSVVNLIPAGKKVIITVPNFLGGSHVRKFDTEEEVIARYGSVITLHSIKTIGHGTGKIFVFAGIKNN